MCSSRYLGDGLYEITTPCSWASPGHLLGTHAGYRGLERELREAQRHFDDFLARLALSQNGNGRAWGEGVAVQPPDEALAEAPPTGTVHESLVVEEPRAAA
jgi:hypothetical protein